MNTVFNYTAITELGPQEALHQAHVITAIPAIWIMYSFMVLVSLIAGSFMARRSPKYWSIFFLLVILGAIFATILSLMPNTVQSIANIFAS